MKKAIITVALLACTAFAADFSFSLIGKPSEKHSLSPETALFDGKLPYNSSHIIWDSATASKGCGVLLDFHKPTRISRIVVVTAKPNHLPYAPERTEFQSWDSDKQAWTAPASIADVTGKGQDKAFVTATPIQTEWKADAETEAVRILMFGQAIWCTEVQVFDNNGRQLAAEPICPAPENSTALSLSDNGGGASVNINFYSKKQPYVGNPNPLNRLDRVILLFDARSCIANGKVSKAVLNLSIAPMGILDCNRFGIDQFTTHRTSLRSMDLIATDTTPVADFMFDRLSPTTLRLDITDHMNKALANGEGFIGLRLRNITLEKVGNRQNKAEGLVVNYGKTTIDIIQ